MERSFRVDSVLEHFWRKFKAVSDEVFAYDHNRYARGPHILLRTGIDQAEFADIITFR